MSSYQLDPALDQQVHQHVSNALLEVLSGNDADEVAKRYALDPAHLKTVHRGFVTRMDSVLHASLSSLSSDAIRIEQHRGVYAAATGLGLLYGLFILFTLLLPGQQASSTKAPVAILLLMMYIPGLASIGLNALSRSHGWSIRTRRIGLFFILLPAVPIVLVIIAAITHSTYLQDQFQQILLATLAGGLVLGLSDYVLG